MALKVTGPQTGEAQRHKKAKKCEEKGMKQIEQIARENYSLCKLEAMHIFFLAVFRKYGNKNVGLLGKEILGHWKLNKEAVERDEHCLKPTSFHNSPSSSSTGEKNE